MFWRLNDLGGGRPNQLSPHPQAYNLTQRKVQALSMARWSLFRSGNNQMRLLAITGIEETSGSIVMAAVETRSAGISTCAPSRSDGGHQVCKASPTLTDISPSRTPVCLKSDIFSVRTV